MNEPTVMISTFAVHQNKVLLLKRSSLIANNRHIWSAISDYLDIKYLLYCLKITGK